MTQPPNQQPPQGGFGAPQDQPPQGGGFGAPQTPPPWPPWSCVNTKQPFVGFGFVHIKHSTITREKTKN
ncbi:hypothetical protein, partial [Streptomyces sp. ID05-47C]|uniref:hypothetical protein n=1 Tax=Streptomyces sp. ID05-47C TaxID=3028665 RepID=UPI0029A89E8E